MSWVEVPSMDESDLADIVPCPGEPLSKTSEMGPCRCFLDAVIALE
jgi:hypothetical protein